MIKIGVKHTSGNLEEVQTKRVKKTIDPRKPRGPLSDMVRVASEKNKTCIPCQLRKLQK